MAEGFDEERLRGLFRLLGPGGVRMAADSLRGIAADAFSERGREREEAHALASQAELVGLMGLGAACRAVEVAARAGLPLSDALGTARARRDEAVAALEALGAHDDIELAITAAADLLRTPRDLNSPPR